ALCAVPTQRLGSGRSSGSVTSPAVPDQPHRRTTAHAPDSAARRRPAGAGRTTGEMDGQQQSSPKAQALWTNGPYDWNVGTPGGSKTTSGTPPSWPIGCD